MTLCGLQAVTELPLSSRAENMEQCGACFRKVDRAGILSVR